MRISASSCSALGIKRGCCNACRLRRIVVTFNYTGGEQHFKIPSGVTQRTVVTSGASGPNGPDRGYC
jgi:hypothetical protein